MSESEGSQGSSFNSSTGGSSLGSDNTDSRALASLQTEEGAESGEADDFDNNKSFQEGVFATLFILSKNRSIDLSLRFAALKVVLEFLQMFRVIFNASLPWKIQRSLWIFKAIEWLLFRMIVVRQGYSVYISAFYFLVVLVLTTLAAAMAVAVVLKGDEANNIWLRRLILVLQAVAVVIFTIMWPAILDYCVFLLDCNWQAGLTTAVPYHHIFFTEQSCVAMPHLAHMLISVVTCIIFAAAVLLMSVGTVDLNPMTRSWLATADGGTCFKILALKMIMVVADAVLDQFLSIQVVIMFIAGYMITHLLLYQLPYYNKWVNIIWTGLWCGLLAVIALLLGLAFNKDKPGMPQGFAEKMTQSVLTTIFPAAVAGMFCTYIRMRFAQRVANHMHSAFQERKAAVVGSRSTGADAQASSVVSLMTDLKTVYRFRDVRQLSVLCRDMRVWDEDGVPDPDASEFGEFVIKCGMARMPNNPGLAVMYANFLIEVHKDGQGARTQLQLAQKSNPSLLDSFYIFVAQQLAKQLKRDGDGLDLMGYVEYQCNYRSCVRAHKAALMAQRQFWNCLLRDKISFKEMQNTLDQLKLAEQRATSVYRRVLERYPNNGRLLKVYGRFLEFVRNDPWTASKYYQEAQKRGTTESLLSLTATEDGASHLSAAGTIDEAVDGLIIINAQGIILMVNAAAFAMFGYDKGELEGKNVSVLMPQPFSSHHNQFLQRFVDTGIPHIVGVARSMVALHKDRSMFPISLCAMHLTGAGADQLFIGVVRKSVAKQCGQGNVVRFFTSASGIILCADGGTADAFGMAAPDLVGRSFSSLCHDVEGVNKFLATAMAATTSDGGIQNQQPMMQTQLLHAFLPAVDVELGVHIGGALEDGSDYRTISVEARVLSDAAAVMVLDHKGRIEYATSRLSTMLGYPISSLTKMDLNALLPQPYCQMHGSWFKDSQTMKVQPTGCRAGGVVHLLGANGAKHPVTVKMSVREDAASGHITHIVQVTNSSEAARQDQQRLVVTINHKGTVMEVNAGAPKSLFGFNPSDLVGRPIAAIVDVFGLWRHEFGEDESLLGLLAAQAMAASGALSNSALGLTSSMSWRVGVHLPVKSDADISQHAALLATQAGSHTQVASAQASMMQVLQQQKRLRAACMSFALLVSGDDQLVEDETNAGSTPVAQISLHRSDALTVVLELDKGLAIARADDAAGLMFGMSAKALLKQPIMGLLGLPSATTFDQLLGAKSAAAKKGAMKGTSAGGASRMGQAKVITTRHLGDGKPLALEMQALSYAQGGKTRYLIRLRMLDAVSAGCAQLLALKQGQAATPGTKVAVVESSDGSEAVGGGRGNEDSDGEDVAAGHQSDGEGCCDPKSRVSEWVREASRLPKSGLPSPDHQQKAAGLLRNGKHACKKAMALSDEEPEDPAVYVSAKPYGGGHDAADGRWPHLKQQRGWVEDASNDGDDDNAPFKLAAASCPGSVAESASVGGGSSMGSQSEGGAGSISSAADTAHEEDLAIDARRAKRLKKLSRMVHSSVAQYASTRWCRHTQFLLAIIAVAHVACFAVVVTQVNSRASNLSNVDTLAKGSDKFMATTLRANFLAKCWNPLFSGMWACNPDNMAEYIRKQAANIALARTAHQTLYLGSSSLKPFADKRLLDFWTYNQLHESKYYLETLTGTKQTENSTRTLWEMGNVLLAGAEDVLFEALMWQATGDTNVTSSIQQTSSWQYVYKNGPASIFKGYSWSLDTFVDYMWQDLTALSIALIALLVVEAVIVQLGCMAYEFYLLQQANVSHMRLFSVLLALPSATIRLMVQHQLTVDDEGKADVDDDDDMDLAEGAGGAGAASAADAQGNTENTGDKKPQKSVRVAANVADDSNDDDDKPAKSKKEKAKEERGKGKAAALNNSKKKPQLTGWVLARKKCYKLLFGWLDPKFKRNGKKLIPSTAVVWKFMVPLLLWVASVGIIYGISYDKLRGLQAPLAAMDLAAHVMYRMSPCRLYSNFLAFSSSAASNVRNRAALVEQVDLMRSEYTTLLYGGNMILQANVSFVPVSPAAAFSDGQVANLFFKTTACLRNDQSTCYPKSSDLYTITHSGLDAMINKYLDQMTVFSKLPDDLAWANHTSYEWALKVGAQDIVDGLYTASDLFLKWTNSRFQSVITLHIILLVVSVVCMLLFVLVLYRPYIQQQHSESKAVVGMLSLLPTEVDIEGHIKTCVLGITKVDNNGNRSMLDPTGMMGPGAPATGMMSAAAMGMMPGGQGQNLKSGWFGSRRGSNAGVPQQVEQQQQQMMMANNGAYYSMMANAKQYNGWSE